MVFWNNCDYRLPARRWRCLHLLCANINTRGTVSCCFWRCVRKLCLQCTHHHRLHCCQKRLFGPKALLRFYLFWGEPYGRVLSLVLTVGNRHSSVLKISSTPSISNVMVFRFTSTAKYVLVFFSRNFLDGLLVCYGKVRQVAIHLYKVAFCKSGNSSDFAVEIRIVHRMSLCCWLWQFCFHLYYSIEERCLNLALHIKLFLERCFGGQG